MVEDIIRKALLKAMPENIDHINNIIEENVMIFKEEVSSFRFFKIDKSKIFVRNINKVVILTFMQDKIIKETYDNNKKSLLLNDKSSYSQIKSSLSKKINTNEFFKLSELENSMIGFFQAEFQCILPNISKYLNKRYSRLNSSLALSLLKTMRLLYKNSQESLDPEIKEILIYLGVKNNQGYNKIFLDNKEKVLTLAKRSHYLLLYYMSILFREEKYKKEYIQEVYEKLTNPSADMLVRLKYLDCYSFKRLYAKSYSINSILFFVESILNADVNDLTDYTLEDINDLIHSYQTFGSIKYKGNNYFESFSAHYIIESHIDKEDLSFNHMIKSIYDGHYVANNSKKKKVKISNDEKHSFILSALENSKKEFYSQLEINKKELFKKEAFVNFMLEEKVVRYFTPRSRNYKIKKITKIKDLNDYSISQMLQFIQTNHYSYNVTKNIIFYEYYSKETKEFVGMVWGISADGFNYTFNNHLPKIKNKNYIKKILPKLI